MTSTPHVSTPSLYLSMSWSWCVIFVHVHVQFSFRWCVGLCSGVVSFFCVCVLRVDVSTWLSHVCFDLCVLICVCDFLSWLFMRLLFCGRLFFDISFDACRPACSRMRLCVECGHLCRVMFCFSSCFSSLSFVICFCLLVSPCFLVVVVMVLFRVCFHDCVFITLCSECLGV